MINELQMTRGKGRVEIVEVWSDKNCIICTLVKINDEILNGSYRKNIIV